MADNRAQILLRLPKTLKVRLRAKAKSELRSVTKYLQHLVEKDTTPMRTQEASTRE